MMFEVLAWSRPWGDRIPENMKEKICRGEKPRLDAIPVGVNKYVKAVVFLAIKSKGS